MQLVRMITVAAAALAVGAVAACGQGSAVSGDAVAPQAAAAQDDSYGGDQNAAPAAAETTKLGTATAGDLGQVVTNQDGRTLYLFTDDSGDPPKSACTGDCAVAWPPALAPEGAEIAVQGVDKALVGTVDRGDGTKQVRIGKWLAYTYAKDTAPGQATGQGVNGKWFAITPAGKKAASQAAGQAVQLAVMKVNKVGQIIVDAQGMTLYRFAEDQKGVKSNCNGDCAAKWPPYLVPDGAQVQAQGIDPALITTITRDDGTKQVAVAGWMLYRFAQDKVPCDIKGHGLNGTWHATTAAGGKAPL